MSTDEFTKLFTYMSERFNSIDAKLESKAESSDVSKVLTILDGLSKRQEISEDERLVMNYQLTRMHDWVEQAAQRINLTFVH